MPSIRDVANPEATKDAVVTVTNPNEQKFRVKVTFYPNRLRSRVRAERNGHGESGSEMETLAALADLDENLDEGYGPLEAIRRQNEESLLEAAAGFCETYVAWDLTGPLENGDGKVIVAPEEVIPLKAEFVRWVPPWLRAEINTGVQEILFPSLRELSPSRRR